MKGEKIKELLKEKGFSISEVAKKMGESNQNLFAALAKTDVKSGLLERISAATGISIPEFYGIEPVEASDVPAKEIIQKPADTHDKYITALSDQQAMTRQALDQVDTLLRILDTKLDMMK